MKLLSSNTLSGFIRTCLPQIALIAIFTATHAVCGFCCMNSNINHHISKFQCTDTIKRTKPSEILTVKELNRYYRKQLNSFKREHRKETGYDKTIKQYRSSWNKLIPSYSKIQIAGGIGRIATGPGWNYGRKSQWETDFLIGYLPKYESKEWKITLTLKQNYIPWQIPLGNTPLTFSPLSCGIYGCLLIGGDFWIKEPLRYPDRSYYRFPTRIRGHIFFGERFTLNIKHGMSRAHKSIAFYYEMCTHDLALMSLCTNKYLSLKDAVSLAFGVKLQFF